MNATNNTNTTNNTKAYTEKEIKTALFNGYTKVYEQLINKAIEIYGHDNGMLDVVINHIIEIFIKSRTLFEMRTNWNGNHNATNWDNVDSEHLRRVVSNVFNFDPSVKRFKRIYKTVTGKKFVMENSFADNCWVDIWTTYHQYKSDDPFKENWYNIYCCYFSLTNAIER